MQLRSVLEKNTQSQQIKYLSHLISEANLNSKRRVDDKQPDSLQKRIVDLVGHKRTSSHDKDDF